MPAGRELREKLVGMGIWDEGMTEEAAQKRYARFEGTEFGVAPKEVWGKLRRDLLEFEHRCAYS